MLIAYILVALLLAGVGSYITDPDGPVENTGLLVAALFWPLALAIIAGGIVRDRYGA